MSIDRFRHSRTILRSVGFIHHHDYLQYYLAGLLLPLLGYTVAALIALAFGFSYEDRLAIAAETVNFNTVIALSTSVYVLKGYSPKELAILLSNLTIIMTPIPLLIHFAWSKIRLVYFLIYSTFSIISKKLFLVHSRIPKGTFQISKKF